LIIPILENLITSPFRFPSLARHDSAVGYSPKKRGSIPGGKDALARFNLSHERQSRFAP
jgi:hypothetical protein